MYIKFQSVLTHTSNQNEEWSKNDRNIDLRIMDCRIMKSER